LKALLVYPQYPDTFWSFKHALRLTPRKALNTPLGILTLAALLPAAWEKRVVDMNVARLTDRDIKWADYVFISALIVQRKSAKAVIDRCHRLGIRVVAGGPLFTIGYETWGFDDLDDVDHLILNEGEITVPLFLKDLANGCPQHVYRTEEKADITKSPTPLFSLLDLSKYASATIQYSRGCPNNCEFCDIILMDGHKPRTKTREQLLAEMETLYRQGYRGSVFLVDDNLIGNRAKLKQDILPAIISWQEAKGRPFTFLSQACISLADDEELMSLMSSAGFDNVFVGIESPNEDSLIECNKFANKNRDLLASVKKLQNHGFQVMGGFIVGFDHDPVSIFKRQIEFIQKSGIVNALVNLLNAPARTRLWHRLEKENRIIPEIHASSTTDNTDCLINFIPKMRFNVLISGYKEILNTIYTPKNYYERIYTFFKEYKPNEKFKAKLKPQLYLVVGFIRAAFVLGVKDIARLHYWKLFFTTLRRSPRLLGLAITLAAQGFHFRKTYERIKDIKVDEALLLRQQELLDSNPA
jgi:radical SAM superfamily enzyme YgiQ (UPF0313 family)